MSAAAGTRVYLEVGTKRVFAVMVDHPGWARSGRTAEAALAALAEYEPRYAPVVRRAGHPLPGGAGDRLDVVAEVRGTTTTDFGAPDRVLDGDRAGLPADDAARLADLLAACWATLDDVVEGAPSALRRGPRGGGRDRDEVARHVLAAEAAYARAIGAAVRGSPRVGDHAAVTAARAAVLARVRAGDTSAEPAGRWPLRYAVRRIAWHVLDHAWEIEDRSAPAP
ncbi:hypothetical protein [Kineosporia sp. R_H_3]|uniref:hypothetical protein n=1 Tax=Kineosporia sp. R_H_3 TaxID=1961848 RepID=UPI000B4A5F50|nr:hypothetical protein [Kineosporia sp. R_H_3]